MKISVVIPAYNEENYLGECLASVQKYAPPELEEILVIDNASTDRTAEVARGFSGVRVAPEPDKGLTKARQRGLLEGRGDLLAFIDADCRVPEWWFPIVREEFSADERLVCLSGPYIYYDLPAWQRGCSSLYWKVVARPVYATTQFMCVGGNFVARKDALFAMGGFDRSIEFYGEDTDIARRLHQHGNVKFHPRFSIYSSGRRLATEGVFRTGLRYGVNYAWVTLFKRPFTHRHTDIR